MTASRPASIAHDPHGPTAFTSNGAMVMHGGTRTVQMFLNVKRVEEWITTLEEVMRDDVPASHPHHWSLCCLRGYLETALTLHQKEHEEVVTDAPCYEDMVAYLAAYLQDQLFTPGQLSTPVVSEAS